jgi:hypothetical protein
LIYYKTLQHVYIYFVKLASEVFDQSLCKRLFFTNPSECPDIIIECIDSSILEAASGGICPPSSPKPYNRCILPDYGLPLS